MAKGTVNKVIILGRLGQDPDMRNTASGTAVANLNIATTEVGSKDESGNRKEMTEWHRVVAFGRTAEVAGQHLTKGSQVYIEGRLQTRKWQDQNGQDRYTTEVVVNELQFVSGGNQSSGGQQQAPSPQQYQQPQQPAQQPQQFSQPPAQGFGQPQQSPPGAGGFDDFDDDVPF